MLMSIWCEKCYCRLGRLYCQFVVVDVVEHHRQIDVETID